MTDWKRKLAAYLHDPPSKCVDIASHEDHAKILFRQAGFSDEEAQNYAKHFAQPSDWVAAAADRLPFPQGRVAGVTCKFDGVRNQFHHPLGSAEGAALFPFHAAFSTAEVARETDQGVQPVLTDESLKTMSEPDAWRARFFAHWRLWARHSTARDYRFAFLPADTRIPDHTVWTHMQVVSALDACADKPGREAVLRPAFLKFQLGPVQDFIAAARSIRDLWSSSYLLSWLMAAGLKALSARIGPDAVIFPNLREQPLFDLHWRDELWSKVNIGSKTVWESLDWSTDRELLTLLTPNLPNVFLAVVPAHRANEMADAVKAAIESEWHKIADAVWNYCEEVGLTADEGEFTATQRKQRFESQVKRFLSLSWQVTPWPDSLQAALNLATGFDEGAPVSEAKKRVEAVVEMAQQQMPFDHRDSRFYTDASKTTLNNLGLGWSVMLALNGWQLDAVRQTRSFEAVNVGGWAVGTFSNKDSMSGREEAVAGGETWGGKARALDRGPWASLFKHDDWLSAPTLIKRVWHLAYLSGEPWKLKTSSQDFPMPDTRSIARHIPFGRDDDKQSEEDFQKDSSEKYFAVLALDGDEIGKWISGVKTPPFKSQLADYPGNGGQARQGSQEYFERDGDPDGKGVLRSRFAEFLKAQRPLSPSYHLQFSEALGNFALHCARTIVEAFDGRLIYAGGDDVLALLPADTALECARSLRNAFQGRTAIHRTKGELFSSTAPGFLSSSFKDDQGRSIAFLVPGPAADCSVGIAIAHFKSPLQDAVRAAQAAEKRAKRPPHQGGLGRSAVAVTLMKRSGEIIEWGAKWEQGLELYQQLAMCLEMDWLSSKFPHRFAELIEVYVTDTTPLSRANQSLSPVGEFPADDIIRREFEHCLSRQRGAEFPRNTEEADELRSKLRSALDAYLGSLRDKCTNNPSDTPPSERVLRSVVGLCQTVAFAHRTANDWSPKGNNQ